MGGGAADQGYGKSGEGTLVQTRLVEMTSKGAGEEVPHMLCIVSLVFRKPEK